MTSQTAYYLAPQRSYLNEHMNGPCGFGGYEIPKIQGAGCAGLLPHWTSEVCFLPTQTHWGSFQINEVS